MNRKIENSMTIALAKIAWVYIPHHPMIHPIKISPSSTVFPLEKFPNECIAPYPYKPSNSTKDAFYSIVLLLWICYYYIIQTFISRNVESTFDNLGL